MAGSESPLALLSTTVRVSPSICGGVRVTVKLPSSSTVPLPISLPSGSVMVTVASGSPIPLTLLPSALTTRPVAGAGTSSPVSTFGATTVAGSDSLPAPSINTTSITSPLVSGGTSGMLKSPLSSTVPSAITLPLSSRISTLVPGSPVPDTPLPSALITTSSGASGAVLSGALIDTPGEVLPAALVCETVTVSPLVNAGSSVMAIVPSLATVPVAMMLPS